MASKIQLRRDTAQNWSNNSSVVLSSGEPGFETDTGKFKIGNGNDNWNTLAYAGSGGVTDNGSVYIGNNAGSCSSADCAVAIGTDAARNNQDCGSIAIGAYAGQCCQGRNSVAIGNGAGECCQSYVAVAIGRGAGNNNQCIGSVAVGHLSGECCQGYHASAMGRRSGRYCQEDYAVAVCAEAGESCQREYSVAIGYRAGNCDQGRSPGWGSGGAIAIGAYAGECCQEYHAIAIGRDAGQCCQGFSAVAIGRAAGNCGQGHGAVAVGKNAGYCDQGDNAVAIGNFAGRCCQGNASVAIGYYAAQNCQQSNAIAIGPYAAYTDDTLLTLEHDGSICGPNDGANSTVTITSGYDANLVRPGMMLYDNGYNDMMILAVNGRVLTLAGVPNSGSITPGSQFYARAQQGTNAIAIGAYAASKTQFPNSIVINSTGNDLASAGSNTLVVKTLRQVTGGSIPTGFYQVAWNPTTGEMIAVTP